MSRYALTEVIEGILGHPVVERGQNAMVRCPFHHDERPSLSIDLDRGLWVCFGCGDKGGIHSLAARVGAQLDDTDVLLRTLDAEQVSYVEERDFAELAKALHRTAYVEKPEVLVRYVAQRGMDGKVVKHFGLGWETRKRAISMPYWDDDVCVGIKYRAADGSKSSEKGSRRAIYNVNDVRGKPTVILCEGESDTHVVWTSVSRLGLGDEVGVGGVPGVSVSRSQWELWALELLWANRVFVLFDADEAGDRGAVTPVSILGDRAVRVRPSRGKDITEHLVQGGTLEELGLGEADLRLRLAQSDGS